MLAADEGLVVQCRGGFCLNIKTKDIKGFNHPTASWRKMIVAVPIDTEVIIESLLGERSRSSSSNPQIVQMSNVKDCTVEHRKYSQRG